MAFSTNVIELYLLPYIVIVPISLKVANHKYSVSYIAGYLNEFLEDLNNQDSFKWEKYHNKYYDINKRTFKEKLIYYGASAEYALMCILTTIMFWIKYYSQSKIEFTTFQKFGYVSIQFVVIILVIYITVNYVSFQKIKPSTISN